MEHNNQEILKDPGGEPGLTADLENSFCPDKDQRRITSCVLTEDLTTDGSRSQSSISRSLQRAETLLKSTFNPSLKWLFYGSGPDEEEQEEHFVVAPNLVSRSSARLLRLQQALLAIAPQWQVVRVAQTGSPQVYAKGLTSEGGVLLLPSSSSSYSSLQGHYRALCRLLEQRSLLLFIHEYTRRARLAAAFISRVSNLLEVQQRETHLNQCLSSWSSSRVGLSSLSQELRVHLNHWSCLFSKVQSDPFLRPAAVHHCKLLLGVRQSLDLLAVQVLVVMEQYVSVVLSAVANTDLRSAHRDLLEDILTGTDMYNQAVGEQRLLHGATRPKTALLQQAQYSMLSLPNSKGRHPAAFSVKEMMTILAVRQADKAAEQLHCWASVQSQHACQEESSESSDAPLAGVRRSEQTWLQLQQTHLSSCPLFSVKHHPLSLHICHKTPLHHIPDVHLENHQPVLVSLQPNEDRQSTSPQSVTSQHPSSLPLSGVGQQDWSSAELLFELLVSSSDLLAPLATQTPTPEAPPKQLLQNTSADVFSTHGKTNPGMLTALIRNTADSVELNRMSTAVNMEHHVEGRGQEGTELEKRGRAEARSGPQRDGDPEREGTAHCLHWPHSVQWLDLGQSLVFADLIGHYQTLVWTLCRKALWLQLHMSLTGSFNLHDNHSRFHILHRLRHVSNTDLVPKECRIMLEDLSQDLLAVTAHAQCDDIMCTSLGLALKDKCLPHGNQGSGSVTPPEQNGRLIMSVTMEHFLLLPPPLLSPLSLCCHQSNSRASGSFSLFPSRLTLQRRTVNLALSAVQLSTVWVISKAYQFLSSWSLSKFLLITQGDLKVLMEPLLTIVHQTKSLTTDSTGDHQTTLHHHSYLLLRQQLTALDQAVTELQTFSPLVLKTFSIDCKRLSGEIFEQTMPSAIHWRPSPRTGFPTTPSEYAAMAAQTMIGPVLEGVALLSEDASVQALSITMTAFMEAWMEHILKQKIKFSVQGALQLKQDFDSIRGMIQSDKYGLSAELHQQLLGLRVFQQVDSAVMCLLQQPQAKPYLQPRAWEPFTRCCPANSSRDSINAVVGSSITNLRSMEGEDLTQFEPSVVTSDLPPVDPSTPGEPYLAPSLALGAAQQEWLDLRMNSNVRRWRLPGLQCLSKSEP